MTGLSRSLSAPPSSLVARRSAAPPTPPATLAQAEDGSATATATAGEGEEERRKAEAKERLEVAKTTAVFSFSVLSGCLRFFPNGDKLKSNVAFSICFFLAFATFISSNALIQLSMSMLDLRADLVSGGQYVAAEYLAVSCAVLSVMTVFSLVTLLRSRPQQYISLAAVSVVLLPAAGVLLYLRWRRRRRTGGSDDEAYNEEHKKELEAVSKITSSVTTSSFGALVGILFSSWGAAAAEGVDTAACVTIFFLFATGIMSMLVMTVTKEASRITQRQFQRRHLITAIRMANASLLCWLACAGLAAGFAVLGYWVFAAFTPLVTAWIICFLLGHCTPAGEANDDDQPAEKREQVEAIEDLASKVTLGGIMGVLAASVGAKYNSQQAGVRDTFVVVLTSAFVSGLGIMVHAAVPTRLARALVAPVAKVLVWSSAGLFAVTVVAVYSVELWTM